MHEGVVSCAVMVQSAAWQRLLCFWLQLDCSLLLEAPKHYSRHAEVIAAAAHLIALLNALLALCETFVVGLQQLITFPLVSLHLSKGICHILGLHLSTIHQQGLILQLDACHFQLQLFGLHLHRTVQL